MITLKVYNQDMKTVKKECQAEAVKIPFGIVRKAMKLFNADTMSDTTQILNVVMNSWDEVTKLLERIFPEMEAEDWDTVDVKELVSVIYDLLKSVLKEILKIPADSKN